MKKFILILLVCAMLVGCLAACDIGDHQPNRQPETSHKQPESTDEQPKDKEKQPFEIYQSPQVNVTNEEIYEETLNELSEYLYLLNGSVNVWPSTFEYDINLIKKGLSPIFVKISPGDYYYMCAYFTASHDDPEEEYDLHCCLDDYTWVSFEKATDIVESYNGQNLIAAFQINRTSITCDILSKEQEIPIIQHYQLFDPEFFGGFNIKEPIEFNHEVIYLTSLDVRVKSYCSLSLSDQSAYISCMYYEDGYYIKNLMKMELSKGGDIVVDLKKEFGEYYDYLTDPDRGKLYEQTNSNEKKTYYLLTDLNSFVDIFKEQYKVII